MGAFNGVDSELGTYPQISHASLANNVYIPFPTLLVNFVKLSLTPKTVFLTKLAAPCHNKRGSGSFVHPYLGDSDAQFGIAVHDHPVERLIEYVRDARAHIREQSNRIADEISGAQDTIELAEYVLTIVVQDARSQLGWRQAHILDGQSVHL